MFRTVRLGEAPKSLPVQLGKIPEIALTPRPPLDAQKTRASKTASRLIGHVSVWP